MSRKQHLPIRMCMGCGARTPQAQLLRVSIGPRDELQLAPRRQPRGRSGYLHRQQQCWKQFTARKGSLRSLGCTVDKARRAAFVEELQQIESFPKMR